MTAGQGALCRISVESLADIVINCIVSVDLRSRLEKDIGCSVGDRVEVSYQYDGRFVKVGEGKQNPFVGIRSL